MAKISLCQYKEVKVLSIQLSQIDILISTDSLVWNIFYWSKPISDIINWDNLSRLISILSSKSAGI